MIFLIRRLPLAHMSLFICFFLTICSCQENPEKWKANGRTVEVVKDGEGFQLLRHGKPYFIKGAGALAHLEKIKEYGGNSVRVWDTNDAGRILDKAHELGLTVSLGIWMTREREGFDYDDKRAVEKQYERIKREVLKYKDHPALLMWIIGNEMNKSSINVRMWDAVNDVAKMIHELDPEHPTSTAVMNVPFRVIRFIKSRCPHIDILSINTYGGLASLSEEIEKSAWDGPYLISEFGALGYWEVLETPWEAPLEQNSSQKAQFIKEKYEDFILKDLDRCLGSYVFLWGNKQEKTHTWFSLFSEKGEKTEAVDVLSHLWTGSWPENRAPKTGSLKIHEAPDPNNIILNPGNIYTAQAEAVDPEGDSLYYHWEVLPEVEVLDGAVDRFGKPDPIAGTILTADSTVVRWAAPEEKGAYRLFVNIRDGHNNLATANIPFLVGSGDTLKLSEKETIEKNYFERLLNHLVD